MQTRQSAMIEIFMSKGWRLRNAERVCACLNRVGKWHHAPACHPCILGLMQLSPAFHGWVWVVLSAKQS